MRKCYFLIVVIAQLFSVWDSLSSLEFYNATSFQNSQNKIFFGPSENIVALDSFVSSALFLQEGVVKFGLIPMNYQLSYVLEVKNACVTNNKLDFLSHFNELNFQFDLLCGLFVDLGKAKIETGHSYFKSPTDFLGASRSVSDSRSDSSYKKTREGFVNLNLQYINGGFSVRNLFVPRFTWDTNLQPYLDYITSQQNLLRDLLSVSFRLFDIDFEFYGYHENNPINNDSSCFKFGNYIAGVLFDVLELHMEASVSEKNSSTIAIAVDTNSFLTASTNWAWYPQLCLGLVWSIDSSMSLMAEYYYNGKGLASEQYWNTVDYTKNLYYVSRSTEAYNLFFNYGVFNVGQHYLMERFSKYFDKNKFTFEVINVNSLTDGSGYVKLGLTFNQDNYNLNGSLSSFYGKQDSEMGLIPEYWKIAIEIEIFGVEFGSDEEGTES
jgi:hypothetical protein